MPFRRNHLRVPFTLQSASPPSAEEAVMTAIPHTGGKLVGESVKRREDGRFITGRGKFTDDLKLHGLTHAAFVRSPHAHAAIRSIDTSRARAVPGVHAIYTGSDLSASGVGSIPPG